MGIHDESLADYLTDVLEEPHPSAIANVRASLYGCPWAATTARPTLLAA
jgi:hypothetical protein